MSTATILLLSDAPEFFERRDTYFDRRDVEVFCAMDPGEARSVLGLRRVDLVLSRGAPGSLSAREVRGVIPQDVPLLVLATQDDDPALIAAYERAPGIAVLWPPYQDSVMTATTRMLRKSTRRYLRLLVQMAPTEQGKGKLFGFCANISTGGMLVETRQPIEVDATIALSFMLPSASRMTQVTARVVRQATSSDPRSFRYGLMFLDLAGEDRDRVAQITAAA